MSNLASLTTQRDGLLKKIREIEAACEGIENENNAKRVQELNLEQAQYSAQRQEIAAKLAVLDGNLANINAPIGKVPSTDISAKSSILNVIITPIANTEKIKPCSIDVRINVFIRQILPLLMLCVLLPVPDFLQYLN